MRCGRDTVEAPNIRWRYAHMKQLNPNSVWNRFSASTGTSDLSQKPDFLSLIFATGAISYEFGYWTLNLWPEKCVKHCRATFELLTTLIEGKYLLCLCHWFQSIFQNFSSSFRRKIFFAYGGGEGRGVQKTENHAYVILECSLTKKE